MSEKSKDHSGNCGPTFSITGVTESHTPRQLFLYVGLLVPMFLIHAVTTFFWGAVQFNIFQGLNYYGLWLTWLLIVLWRLRRGKGLCATRWFAMIYLLVIAMGIAAAIYVGDIDTKRLSWPVGMATLVMVGWIINILRVLKSVEKVK